MSLVLSDVQQNNVSYVEKDDDGDDWVFQIFYVRT